MAGKVDLLVTNGTVVTSDATFAADIAIADEKFAAIAAPGTLSVNADAVYDARGKHVLPEGAEIQTAHRSSICRQ